MTDLVRGIVANGRNNSAVPRGSDSVMGPHQRTPSRLSGQLRPCDTVVGTLHNVTPVGCASRPL